MACVPSNFMANLRVPNFLQTIVPKALQRRLCARNFVPIQY